MSNKHSSNHRKAPFYRCKRFLWPAGVVIGLLMIILLAFRVSPWPGALIIRWFFTQNGLTVTKALEAHKTPTVITIISDQQYKPGDRNAHADVYLPTSAKQTRQKLPVVIWTHGGAWLSGSKTNAAPYFKLIAAQGYAVVAPDYALAPAAKYPTPIHELNALYSYLEANTARLGTDTSRIILAGDSAGAQLTAQMAALITNPAYAHEVGITPTLKPEQLRGIVLNCGIYKTETLAHPNPTISKLLGWGDDVTVWAYSGTHDFSNPVIRQMSPYYHVTKDFPPTYISGGNADPLTDVQSKPLANHLQSLNVPVTSRFYPASHTPALPHEYQFNLDNADGQNALQATLAFIKARTE